MSIVDHIRRNLMLPRSKQAREQQVWYHYHYSFFLEMHEPGVFAIRAIVGSFSGASHFFPLQPRCQGRFSFVLFRQHESLCKCDFCLSFTLFARLFRTDWVTKPGFQPRLRFPMSSRSRKRAEVHTRFTRKRRRPETHKIDHKSQK